MSTENDGSTATHRENNEIKNEAEADAANLDKDGRQEILRAENISLRIRGQSILDNISFSVAAGNFFTILGPSGAGKTSLLRVLAGLERERALGEVFIRGQRMTGKKPAKRNLAMVFQNYSLYPQMSVAGNIGFPLRLLRKPRRERRKTVATALQEMDMGIEEHKDALPSTLSMGQKQRTALERATIRKHDILLLDEPLSEVDNENRMLLRARFRRMCRDWELTVLYVTNNEEEAYALSDTVLLLHQGQVAQRGSPQEVYSNPRNLFAASFFGSPALNTARAWPGKKANTFLLGGPDSARAVSVPVPLPGGEEPLLAALRPEKLTVVPATDPEALWQANVELCERLSPDKTYLHLDWPEGWISLRFGETPPRKGSRVGLTFDPKELFFFEEESGERRGESGERGRRVE